MSGFVRAERTGTVSELSRSETGTDHRSMQLNQLMKEDSKFKMFLIHPANELHQKCWIC
ncbi:hypothetical protein CAEBREN_11821 [Caenorhabditis brenneri]|uniref:Uncharacterized protein n=1 Tax=Caenorhabditis brenneri TaxID=135651 RepID=G0N5Y7_CAEBE|nr:hypothetical protein CAEBREN_11821 [Caenorhabditis brenneri]